MSSVGYAADPFGPMALRVRGIRYWWAGLGVLTLVSLYVVPLASVLRVPEVLPSAPVRAQPLPRLLVPAVSFPLLRPPAVHPLPPLPNAASTIRRALHAPPVRPVRKTAATRSHKQPLTGRIPVVTDTHQQVVATSSSGKSARAHAPDPFAGAPVVQDNVGALPEAPALPTDATAPDAAAAPPAAAPTDPSDPPASLATGPTRTLSDAGETDVSSSEVTAPTADATTGTTPAVVSSGDSTASDPAPTPSATNDTATTTAPPAAPTATSPPAAAAPTASAPASSPAAASSATTPAAGAPIRIDGATDVVIAADASGALTVTVDGTATHYDPGTVASITLSAKSLTVSAASTIWKIGRDGSGSVDGAGLPPIDFTGAIHVSAPGDGTLDGPAADTTWNITGSDSGAVAGLAFDGFANLVGATGNQDAFVVEAGGYVSSVDGGDGGYDTLSTSGAATVVSAASGAQSGTVTVDGHAIHYSGLEPIGITGTGDVTVDATGVAGDDPIEIEMSDANTVEIKDAVQGVMESNTVSLSGLKSLTIKAGERTATIATNLLLPGVEFSLDAGEIEVPDNVTVDTRTRSATATTGDSGGIELKASTITIGAGAAILAGVDERSSFAAGAITIAAESSLTRSPVNFIAEVSDNVATVTIGSGAAGAARTVIDGGDIEISASAEDVLVTEGDFGTYGTKALAAVTNLLNQIPGLAMSQLIGVAGQASVRHGTATIDLTNTSIKSAGEVSVGSTATANASFNIVSVNGLAGQGVVALAIGYGEAFTTATTTMTNTSVEAEGAVEVKSSATSEAEIKSRTSANQGLTDKTKSGDNASVAIAIANTSETSHVSVSRDSSIHSTNGSVGVDAEGEVTNFAWSEPKIEEDGTVALAFSFDFDVADVTAVVDGVIDAAAGAKVTFNAVKGNDVDYVTDTIHIPDHGFTEGEAVVYSHGDTQAALGTVEPPDIGGLTDGETYYVHVVDKDHIQLLTAPSIALSYVLPKGYAHDPTQSLGRLDEVLFDSSGVDVTNNTITFARAHPTFTVGEELVYFGTYSVLSSADVEQSSDVDPLIQGSAYLVKSVSNGNTITLTDLKGNAVDLTAAGEGTHAFMYQTGVGTTDSVSVNPGADAITFAAGHPAFTEGERLTYLGPADGNPADAIGGLSTLGVYAVHKVSADTIQLIDAINLNFVPSAIDASAFTIDLGYQPALATGQPVIYVAADPFHPVAGLFEGATYFLIVQANSSLIQLSATPGGAPLQLGPGQAQGTQLLLVTTVNLTSAGVGGQQFRYETAVETFDPKVAVDPTKDTITFTSPHGFYTGEPLLYRVDQTISRQLPFSDLALETGLVKVDNTTFTAPGDWSRVAAGDAVTLLIGDADVKSTIKSATYDGSSKTTFVLMDTALQATGTLEGASIDEGLTVNQPDEPIAGLEDYSVYYAVVVDPYTIRLVSSFAAAALNATPIDLTEASDLLGTGLGTAHVLSAFAACPGGICIDATLDATNTATASAELDGATKPAKENSTAEAIEFSKKIASISSEKVISGLDGLIFGIGGLIKEVTAKTPETPVKGTANFSAGGALIVNYANHNVAATVGDATPTGCTRDGAAQVTCPAELSSSGEIDVSAKIDQASQVYVTAGATSPEDKGEEAAVALALGFGVFTNTATATINPSAMLNAAEKTSVTADVAYPFLIANPLSAINPIDYLAVSGTEGWAYFNDGTLGYSSNLFNTWAMTEAEGAETSIGGTLALNLYTNVAKALIASGAQINQTDADRFRDGLRAVDVTASVDTNLISVAGVAGLSLNIEGLIGGFGALPQQDSKDTSSRGERAIEGLKEVFKPFGAKGEKGGVGVSFLIEVLNNTTDAAIAGGAKVHTNAEVNGEKFTAAEDAAGEAGVRVSADTKTFDLALAVAGAQGEGAKGFGVSGAFPVGVITDVTTAHIDSGAIVDGGPVHLDATDELNRYAIAGGFAVGKSVGVGMSVAVNILSRTTSAYIGAPDGQSPGSAGTIIDSSGDVTVDAVTSGDLWVFAIAGGASAQEKDPTQNQKAPAATPPAKTTDGDEYGDGLEYIRFLFDDKATPAPAPPPAQPPAPAKPQTPSAPKTGLGIAGSLAFNYVGTQTTLAFINDTGKISAHDIGLTTDDSSSIISASGAAAFAFGKDNSKSTGIAGALSFNDVNSITRSYVAGAALTATAYGANDPRGPPGGDVTLIATRSGSIYAFSAGLAVATSSQKSTSLAGSVSVTVLIGRTEATLSNTTVLADGQVVATAGNSSTILTVGGGVAVAIGGGSSKGLGGSLAVNEISSSTKAEISNSHIGTDAKPVSQVGVAASNDNTIRSVAVSAGVATGLSFAATIAVNLLTDDPVTGTQSRVVADVTGSDVHATGLVRVDAHDDSTIQSIAGALALSFKASAIGVSLAFSIISTDVAADITSSTVTAGSVSATAESTDTDSVIDGKIVTLAVGGAASLAGGNGVSAGASVNVIADHVTAGIHGSATTVTAKSGDVDVQAADTATIGALGGNVAIALGGTAAGIGIGANVIVDTATAVIDSARVQAPAGSVLVEADEIASIFAITVGAAGADDSAVGGSITVAVIVDSAFASIVGSADVSAFANVDVKATNGAHIVAVAGEIVVALGAGAAVGAALVSDTIVNDTEAMIDTAAKVSTTGLGAIHTDVLGAGHRGVFVEASSTPEIEVFAIGGGGSGDGPAILGSATVSVIDDTAKAFVGHTGSGTPLAAGVNSAGDVDVAAYSNLLLIGGAGAVAIGLGSAGVGVGADAGVATLRTTARIGDGASVRANGSIFVVARKSDSVYSISASGAAGFEAAVAATAGVSVLTLPTTATIDAGSVVWANGNVVVSARDDTGVVIVSGNITISGTVASIGIAGGVSVINKTTEAYVASGATVTALGNGGGVTVENGAFNNSPAPEASQAPGVTVSFKTSNVDPIGDLIVSLDAKKLRDGDQVVYSSSSTPIVGLENDGVYYVVNDTGTTFQLSKTKGGPAVDLKTPQGGPAPAVAHSVQRINGIGLPNITNSNLNPISPNTSAQTATRDGLVVVAVSINNIAAAGVAAGISAFGVAVQVAGSVGAHTINTRAHIDAGASINPDETNANAGQSVYVDAGRSYQSLTIGGGGNATAGVGAVPAVAVPVLSGDTTAYIGSTQNLGTNAHTPPTFKTTVTAKTDVDVEAHAQETFTVAAAGISVATTAIAGSVAVVALNVSTTAVIGGDVHVVAGGNVVVLAQDDSTAYTIAGAIGLGLAGGGGAGAFAVTLFTKNTSAVIGGGAVIDATGSAPSRPTVPSGGQNPDGSFVDANGNFLTTALQGVAVQARSTEHVVAVGGSAGGGEFVGIAGAVTVELMNADAFAAIEGGATVNTPQSVNVSATDTVDSTAVAGSLGVGGAGVGASVDVELIRNDVTALVVGSAVSAGDTVTVNGLSRRTLSGFGIAVGAGGFGLGGGIVVFSVGGDFTSSYTNPDPAQKSQQSANALSDGKTDVVSSLTNDLTQAIPAVAPAPPAPPTFQPANVNASSHTIQFATSPGFYTGEAVVYHAGQVLFLPPLSVPLPILGLADGATYYVIADPHDPTKIQLAATALDATEGHALPIAPGPAIGTQRLAPAAAAAGQQGNQAAGGTGTASTLMSAVGAREPAQVGSGTTATIDASAAVTARAVALNARAKTTLVVVAGGAAAGGAGGVGVGLAVITLAADVTAAIGPGSTMTAAGTSGALSVEAQSDNTIGTVGFAGAASGVVALGAAVAVVNDTSRTRALLGASVDDDGDVTQSSVPDAVPRPTVGGDGFASVTVKAESSRHLNIATGAAQVSAGLGAGVAITVVSVTGETRALVGANRTIGTAAKPIGALTVLATATVAVEPHDPDGPMGIALSAGSLGLAGGVVVVTIGTANEDLVAAEIGDHAVVEAQGTVIVRAASSLTADHVLLVAGSAGFVALGGGYAGSTIQGTTRAQVDGDARVDAGSLAVRADGTAHAAAELDAVAIGIAGASGGQVTATVDADVTALVGPAPTMPGAATRVSTNGPVDVEATSAQNATATGHSGGGGAVGLSVLNANAALTSSTSAGLGSGTSVPAAGGLTVRAETLSASSSATVLVVTGGEVSIGNTTVTAKSTPQASAFLGNAINVGSPGSPIQGDVSVTATGRGEADASGSVYGGGGIEVGIPQVYGTDDPSVDAYIGTASEAGTVVVTTKSIHVQAELTKTAQTSLPDDTIQSADKVGDTLTFTFPLAEGASVQYHAGVIAPFVPEPPIGGLHDGAVYTLLDAGTNLIRLGTLFSLDNVDPTRETITIPGGVGFQTGDCVVYDPRGLGSILQPSQAGATTCDDAGKNGTEFYVRVVNSTTIKLYTTQAAATNTANDAPVQTTGVSVDGTHLTFSTAPFSTGQAVMYRAPATLTFSSANAGNNCAVGSPVICGSNQFASGDAVVYHALSGNALGGLTDGQTYYVFAVHVFGVSILLLADSYCHAVGADADPSHCAGVAPSFIPITATSNNADLHSLARDLGGLDDGVTYYVVSASTSSSGEAIQLSKTPNGTPISFDATHRSGPHDFGLVQVDLTTANAKPGQQALYVDLSTGLPFGDCNQSGLFLCQRLFAPGGASLLSAYPPAGDGVSSVTAQGGTGGVGNFSFTKAALVGTPSVTATLAAATLTAGQDVELHAISALDATTYSNTAGGGVINVGKAIAETDLCDVDPTGFPLGDTQDCSAPTISQVGDETKITAGRDVTIDASNDHSISAIAVSDGGGLVSGNIAYSYANLRNDVEVQVGGSASIAAGGSLRLHVDSGTTGGAQSETSAFAVGGGADSNNTLDPSTRGVHIGSANDQAQRSITIGAGAFLHGNTVDVMAKTSTLDLAAVDTASSASPVIVGVNTAFANAEVDAYADTFVDVQGGAVIRGDQGVDLEARAGGDPSDDLKITRSASTSDVSITGFVQHEETDGIDSFTTYVRTEAGAMVIAGARAGTAGDLLASLSGLNLALYAAGRNGAIEIDTVLPGDKDFASAQNGSRRDAHIAWDANVVVLGGTHANPTLVVDATGHVVADNGVQLINSFTGLPYTPAVGELVTLHSANPTAYTIADILNSGHADVLFQTEQASSLTTPLIENDKANGKDKPWPIFEFQDTLAGVTILDASAFTMNVGKIDLVNPTAETGHQPVAGNPVTEMLPGTVGFYPGALFPLRVPIQFDVRPSAGSALAPSCDPPAQECVDIEKSGGGNVVLNGGINNPVGATRIVVGLGNVTTSGKPIVTNTLDVEVPTGSIGTATAPLTVYLVQFTELPHVGGPTTTTLRRPDLVAHAHLDVNLVYRGLDRVPGGSTVTISTTNVTAGRTKNVSALGTLDEFAAAIDFNVTAIVTQELANPSWASPGITIHTHFRPDGDVGATHDPAVYGNDVDAANLGVPIQSIEGRQFSGVVAAFTDSDSKASASAFTATIDWGDGPNEMQSVSITGSPTAGAFILTWTPPGGVSKSTASIAYNANAAQVCKALTDTFGPGNFSCAGGPLPGSPVAITFVGAYAATDVAQLSAVGFFGFGSTAAVHVTTATNGGDVSTGTVSGSAGAFTVSGTHTYGEEGAYSVLVTITKNSKAFVAIHTTGTVVDAPLTAGLQVGPSAILGTPTSASLIFTDSYMFGPLSDFTVSIDWGDGANEVQSLSIGGGPARGTFVLNWTPPGGTLKSTGALPGNASAAQVCQALSAAFGDNNFSCTGGPLAGAIAITFMGAYAGTDVAQLTTTDSFIPFPRRALPFTVVTTTADGGADVTANVPVRSTPIVLPFGGRINLFVASSTHTYGAPGTYTIIGTVVDIGGSRAVAIGFATVTDQPITGKGTTFNTIEGQPGVSPGFSGTVATFTSPDTSTTTSGFSASIDWGDGPNEVQTLLIPGLASGGSFTLNWTPPGGALKSTAAIAFNASAAQVCQALGDAFGQSNFSCTAGPLPGPVIITFVGTYAGTDVALLATTSSLTAPFPFPAPPAVVAPAVNGGDLSTGTITGANGSFTVTGRHTYVEEKTTPYLVRVTISDLHDATNHVTVTTTGNVADAPLNAGPLTLPSATANVPIEISFAFQDTNPAGPASDFTASVTWGDAGQSSALATGGNGAFFVVADHTYTAPGTYQVNVLVIDDGGSHTSAQGTIVIAAPLVANGVPVTATEGLPVRTTVATFTDANTSSTAADYAATIDWGDGSPTSTGTITGSAGSFSVSGTHTYADETTTPFTVKVTITDAHNPSRQATPTSNATVVDAPLHAGVFSLPATGAVNVPVNARFVFTDDNPTPAIDDFTFVIDWGDGQKLQGPAGLVSGQLMAHGTHLYSSPGTFTVTVTVIDEGGSRTSATGSITIVAPSITAQGAPVTATEGLRFSAPVATFTDPDTTSAAADYTAIIDWGDGSLPSVGTVSGSAGSFSVTGTHTYAEETATPFAVTVTILNAADARKQARVTSTATVVDAPLHAVALTLPPQGAVGVSVPFSFVFSDDNPGAPASDFSYTIDWGDGSSSGGTHVTVVNGRFVVNDSHAYSSAGTFTVTVKVLDDGGSNTAASGSIVIGQTEVIGARGTVIAETEGLPFTAVVATFTDPNAAPTDYVATIDWGDGSSSSGTVSGSDGSFSVSGTHTYPEETSAPFVVSVSIRNLHDATRQATVATAATVVDAALHAVALTLPPQAFITVSVPLSFTFSDDNPGAPASDFTFTIDWGDGTASAGTQVTPRGSQFVVNASHAYGQVAIFTVTVTVLDDGGSKTSGSGTIVIAAVPLLARGTSITETEGIPFTTAVASFTDPTSTAADYTATIGWGDGSPTSTGTVTGSAGHFSVSGTHTYPEETGTPFVVTVSIRNLHDAIKQATVATSATVVDAPLHAVALTLPPQGFVNASVPLSFVFSDDNPGAPAGDFTFLIDWGDGLASTGTQVGVSGSQFVVNGSHAYALPGTYIVTVNVLDDGGSHTSAGGLIVIKPSVIGAHGTAITETEGIAFTAVVATFTDTTASAADYAATIDWGDGSSSSGTVSGSAGSFSVSGTHTYAEEGGDGITVAIASVHDATKQATVGSIATVVDAPLQAVALTLPPSGAPNVSVPLSFVFSDDNPRAPASDFSYTIDWGDGSSSAGTHVTVVNGQFVVNDNHAYSTTGTFTVTVTVVDDGGSRTSATGTIVISMSTIAAQGTALTETEGLPFMATVATFTDPTGSAADYTATIDWGDGSSSTGTIGGSAGSFTVSGTHTYADETTTPLTLVVTIANVNDASKHATVNSSATVVDAPLHAVALTLPPSGVVNVTVPLSFTFSDDNPGAPASDFSYTIDWGDGSSSGGTHVTVVNGQFVVNDGHAYSSPGTFTVTITVVDVGGSRTSATGSITIGSTPSINAHGTTLTETEGIPFTAVVATFSDPTGSVADYAATIDWGDGTTSTGTVAGSGGGFTVTGTHTYPEETATPFAITVTITNTHDATKHATVTSTATVVDAPLHAVVLTLPPSGVVNVSVPLSFTFSDDNPGAPASDFSYTIDWGDGSSSAGTQVAVVNGQFIVNDSHAYAAPGTYTMTVTVHDVGGSNTSATGTITIGSQPPIQVTIVAVPFTTPLNVPVTVTVLFTYSNPHAPHSTFTIIINWGDGTITPGAFVDPGGRYVVEGTHTYTKFGWYQITITITDKSGNSATAVDSITAGSAQTTTQGVIDSLSAAIAQATRVQDQNALTAAKTSLVKSLATSLWINAVRLQPTGGAVFDRDSAAVGQLVTLLGDTSSRLSHATLLGWIKTIVSVDQTLAQTAIAGAAGAGGDPALLAVAAADVTAGNQELAAGHYQAAIADYKEAWQDAVFAPNFLALSPAPARAVPAFDGLRILGHGAVVN